MASQLLGIKTRFTNDLGSPLVGGQVYTYFAGTSTNQDSYSDAALTVPNTNPVILDDTGSADIFLKGSYRIRVFDKSGRFIEEQDNVTQAASQGDATELSNKVTTLESDLSTANTEISKVKLDTGITATAKFGGVERMQSDVNSDVVSIKGFGAIGDGLHNNTQAFTKAIAELPIDTNIYLGDGSDTYLLDNVSSLLDANYTGNAVLLVSGNSFYVGSGWLGKANTIYVSSAGLSTDSGLSPLNPTDLTTGFNLIKKYASINPNIDWKLKFAAGTYGNGASRRFEDFPKTDKPVIFEGAEDVDSNAVPTVVFDGWTTAVFRCLKSSGLNILFRNFKFINASADQIFINGSGNVTWFENIHGEAVNATVAYCRGGFAEFHGGKINNCAYGTVFQNVYGSVGNYGALVGSEYTNMSGHGVQISRGSICYVNHCVFDNNNVHIQQSRQSRVRTQGNSFGAFTKAAIEQETAGCLWNDNLSDLDTFAPIPIGKTAVIAVEGGYTSRVHTGSGVVQHWQYAGAAINHTGTARKEVHGDLSPFRMQGFWLKSPTALGRVTYEIFFPVAETVTLEITGESSSSVLATISLTVPVANSRALVTFEFTGAQEGTSGRFVVKVEGRPDIATASFGSTADLSNTAVSNNSVSTMRYRFYATRSVGTGNITVYRMRSYVAY